MKRGWTDHSANERSVIEAETPLNTTPCFWGQRVHISRFEIRRVPIMNDGTVDSARASLIPAR